MKALCPVCRRQPDLIENCFECRGSGSVEVEFAEGDCYEIICNDCLSHIGGGIVPADDPTLMLPLPKRCVFCKSSNVTRNFPEKDFQHGQGEGTL